VPLAIQQPPGVDVSVNNPRDPGVLYIKGSKDVDGSRRLVVDEITAIPEMQARAAGVWNLSELQLAQGSLMLGHDVRLSAAGHHLIITALDDPRALIVTAHFDDIGSRPPTAPILGGLVIRSIAQPDNSAPVTLASHTATIIVVNLLLTMKLYLQTGATAASDDVTISLSSGIPPNDNVFFQKNYASSVFPANSEIEIDLSPGVHINPGEQVNSDISSPNAFTLLHNAALTLPWFALDFHQQGEEDILTETLVLANDLSIAFSNNLELVRPNKDFTSLAGLLAT